MVAGAKALESHLAGSRATDTLKEANNMATKYDKIETAEKLVELVKWQGLYTDMESIVRVQDIIAKSSYEDLAEMAADGAKQDTLFMILTKVWNWQDVVRFWNSYINPEHKELIRMKNKVDELTGEAEHLEGQINNEHQLRMDASFENADLKQRVSALQADVHDRDMTIMSLKAELYDLMKKLEMQDLLMKEG